MKMVDVGQKAHTERVAVATALLRMRPATARAVKAGKVAKGNVLEAARLAAVMAAKRTPDLVPLCHPLALTAVSPELSFGKDGLRIQVTVKTTDRTGVEMEALTACAAAGLTAYDMLKSMDRGMVLESLQLEEKSGGRSGTWRRSRGR
ncbi:MAG: cyclic pyranopterin monophosphate synthase MoaC [Deltaproteobacteria bacterium]|nr:cyclic pyranopterin monophosphate synthase MoaC [Deltaproteobacteria bacterium]